MNIQKDLCKKFGSVVVACDPNKKIGVAISSLANQPIRGKRYNPEDGTEGWFIWGGDFSEAADFFDPIHVGHILGEYKKIAKYLSLAPGYSFIFDDEGYEDVWFDEGQSMRNHE